MVVLAQQANVTRALAAQRPIVTMVELQPSTTPTEQRLAPAMRTPVHVDPQLTPMARPERGLVPGGELPAPQLGRPYNVTSRSISSSDTQNDRTLYGASHSNSSSALPSTGSSLRSTT